MKGWLRETCGFIAFIIVISAIIVIIIQANLPIYQIHFH